ncbi:ABC transporter permease [Candidatus Aerophobetes bacterium]|nr:ABC transporter permease [Candidatus Aerophobetes bacterium]
MFFRRYLLPRLLQYVVVIFIGITLVFIIPRLAPSDPIEQHIGQISTKGQYLEPEAMDEMRETLRELYGLKGSVFQQYGQFWWRLLHLDFGPSFFQFPTPVTRLIMIALPWTIVLMVVSILLAWVMGNLLGGVAGSFYKAKWVRILEAFAMSIYPIPYYIMALIILILFTYVFPLFPLVGAYSVGTKASFSLTFLADVVVHAFLPILSIVILQIGGWFLSMKSITTNVVEEDYVTYAEAAGLPKSKIILQYTMRNAILPQVTGLSLALGFIFSGALITEIVFAYPGVGTLLYRAISAGDYNLIMGIAVFSIIAIATAVLIMDLIYPLFDPRIRYR